MAITAITDSRRVNLQIRGSGGEINNLAHESEADLIVVSTHGMPRLDRVYVGDVANKLIRILGTPLLLLRPTERWQTRTTRFKRLLVSLDGSEKAERILPYARVLADTSGSEIVLLSVPEAEGGKPKIEQYLKTVANALRELGYNSRALVTGSGAVRTILEVSRSENADLIMIATMAEETSNAAPPSVVSLIEWWMRLTVRCFWCLHTEQDCQRCPNFQLALKL